MVCLCVTFFSNNFSTISRETSAFAPWCFLTADFFLPWEDCTDFIAAHTVLHIKQNVKVREARVLRGKLPQKDEHYMQLMVVLNCFSPLTSAGWEGVKTQRCTFLIAVPRHRVTETSNEYDVATNITLAVKMGKRGVERGGGGGGLCEAEMERDDNKRSCFSDRLE